MKLFTVYDIKADLYLTPFFERNSVNAMRGFEQIVNDANTQFSKYPADFGLYEIAEYDEEKGVVIPYEHNVRLALGSDFARISKPALTTVNA